MYAMMSFGKLMSSSQSSEDNDDMDLVQIY